VNATSGTLWFVLAVDGALQNPDPISFELAAGKTRAEALGAGQDELASFLARNQVDAVALAEAASAQSTYQRLLDRMTVELVLEFGAAKAGVDVRRVSRQKIKSLLGLKGRGNTSQFAEEHIPSPLAPYWLKKRDVAAMAALACS
jgi:hypothetical protein